MGSNPIVSAISSLKRLFTLGNWRGRDFGPTTGPILGREMQSVDRQPAVVRRLRIDRARFGCRQIRAEGDMVGERGENPRAPCDPYLGGLSLGRPLISLWAGVHTARRQILEECLPSASSHSRLGIALSPLDRGATSGHQ